MYLLSAMTNLLIKYQSLYLSIYQSSNLIQNLFYMLIKNHIKRSSSKIAIHFPSGDTDNLLLNLTCLYKYKERICITLDNIKNIRLSSITLEDEEDKDIGRRQIMLFVSAKKGWKQILNFQVYQITDGTKTQTYAVSKNPFQRYGRNLN